jgi:hypothetical protein
MRRTTSFRVYQRTYVDGLPDSTRFRDPMEPMLRVLPALIVAVALVWFALASYQRGRRAEQRALELAEELRALEKALSAAEQGLRTLASHPAVPRDVAVTADLTLADVRRLRERKELDH